MISIIGGISDFNMWSFGDSTSLVNDLNEAHHLYGTVGGYEISLVAQNKVCMKCSTYQAEVIERITELHFLTEEIFVITNTPFQYNFAMVTGSSIVCQITTADSSHVNLNPDFVIDDNSFEENTHNGLTNAFSCSFAVIYTTRIDCLNGLGEEFAESTLHCQDPISDLTLVTLSAVINEDAYITITVRGTDARVNATWGTDLLNGGDPLLATPDANGLNTAEFSLPSESGTAKKLLSINAYNDVSYQLLEVDFAIERRISSPVVNVTDTNEVIRECAEIDVDEIIVAVSLTGSGVYICVVFGDGVLFAAQYGPAEEYPEMLYFHHTYSTSQAKSITVIASSAITDIPKNVTVRHETFEAQYKIGNIRLAVKEPCKGNVVIGYACGRDPVSKTAEIAIIIETVSISDNLPTSVSYELDKNSLDGVTYEDPVLYTDGIVFSDTSEVNVMNVAVRLDNCISPEPRDYEININVVTAVTGGVCRRGRRGHPCIDSPFTWVCSFATGDNVAADCDFGDGSGKSVCLVDITSGKIRFNYDTKQLFYCSDPLGVE